MFDDVVVAIPNAQLEGVGLALARTHHEHAAVAASVLGPVGFKIQGVTGAVSPDADFAVHSSSLDPSPVVVWPLEERN